MRDPAVQSKVDALGKQYALYHYRSCPYCIMTRRAIDRLNIPIELRDILQEPSYRDELHLNGGRTTVPCLRIEESGAVRWMYESRDIIDYLTAKFADFE